MNKTSLNKTKRKIKERAEVVQSAHTGNPITYLKYP